MSNKEIFLAVLVISLITILFRSLPFLLFSGKKKTPDLLTYLGKILPYAIMGMLLVFSLRNTKLLEAPYGLAEGAAILTVILLHRWKHNTLLSITVGTLLYMFLVQVVF